MILDVFSRKISLAIGIVRKIYRLKMSVAVNSEILLTQ